MTKREKEFRAELQELCKKYEINLVPQLHITANGILPIISAQDFPVEEMAEPVKNETDTSTN